jgi:predicted Zn-dependent protease
MKWLMNSLQIMLCGVIVCFPVSTAKSGGENYDSSSLTNRIEGIVWDPNRRPVSDIYVELQNENYSTVSRTRTDATGRFFFNGYPTGHYTVKVLTSGTNYLEYTVSFDLVNVVKGGSDTVYLDDIYLKIDKRKVPTGIAGMSGAVFLQDVPEEARRLYKKGLRDLNDGDKGFNEIEQALKVFPAYYDALNTLGCEYVARKEYQKSLEYLIRSIDVNQRSFSSFYALAYACYQLNHRPEALEAARGATIIQPNSVNALLLYGTLLRLDGAYEKSEKLLLEAKKLSNDTIPEVHWQLALLYNKLGRNKESADELELYLKVLPDAPNKKEIQDLIAKLRKESK